MVFSRNSFGGRNKLLSTSNIDGGTDDLLTFSTFVPFGEGFGYADLFRTGSIVVANIRLEGAIGEFGGGAEWAIPAGYRPAPASDGDSIVILLHDWDSETIMALRIYGPEAGDPGVIELIGQIPTGAPAFVATFGTASWATTEAIPS
jgi:hypothetical protein